MLGIRGEPTAPDDPAEGLVWRSIVEHLESPNAQNEFVSVTDVDRVTFAKHPWSIGGGGANELRERLESENGRTLETENCEIGFLVITGEDNCLVLESQAAHRSRLKNLMPLVSGDEVRDWSLSTDSVCLWPNDKHGNRLCVDDIRDHLRFCWSYRVTLQERRAFGVPVEKKGIPWWALRELYVDRLRTPLAIAFACVATHNHFVLDRGAKVFNRTAPIIKLPSDAGEDRHLALVGLLNSSIACFWMKQVSHNKGTQGIGGGLKSEKWENFYAFDGAKLYSFPITDSAHEAVEPFRVVDTLAQSVVALSPSSLIKREVPSAARLADNRIEAQRLQARMVALQEELDWLCYGLYGLLESHESAVGHADPWTEIPALALGQRPFEIVLSRRVAAGVEQTSWFDRHGSTPITEIPREWPAAYRDLVEHRIKLIETNKDIALIEKPEYKRRWNSEPWEEQEQRALKNWLLDRLETPKYRKRIKDNPELTTTAEMADVASADAEFLQVAALYRGRPDFNVAALVAELVEAESVPFLPILRYKPTGLRKREVWERTWEMQREEDRDQTTKHTKHTKEDREIETESDSSDSFRVFGVFRGSNSGGSISDGRSIPVPPKYTNADFLKTDYWRLRGKLDVPKERWIIYPHCSTDSDPTLVVGWAGWNHLEQATALVAYYDARKREGWDAKRLTPLLAGLDQLLPWIHQWHPEIDKEFGETAGQSFQTMLEHDAHELGLTLEDIRNWAPPATARKARPTRKQKASAEDDE